MKAAALPHQPGHALEGLMTAVPGADVSAGTEVAPVASPPLVPVTDTAPVGNALSEDRRMYLSEDSFSAAVTSVEAADGTFIVAAVGPGGER